MHTIRDLELAARQRAEDARVLERGGRSHCAAYIVGYVAEMTLKVTFFKVARPRGDTGMVTTDEVLGQANKLLGRRLGHDLIAWGDAINIAVAQKCPDRGSIARSLVGHCTYLNDRWKVKMRYDSDDATGSSYSDLNAQVAQICRVCEQLTRMA